MKEICLLNDSFPPEIDGVANAVVNYAQVLENRNIPVSVITPEYENADDSAFHFPVLRYSSMDLREKTGYTAGIPLSYRLLSKLEGHNVGLLHSHCPIASTLLARSLRESLDVPLVMTYHTKFDIDIRNLFRMKLLQEGSIRALVNNVSACDEVWTVSKGAGENLRKLGYEGDYIVMENGVDIPKGRVSEEVILRYTGMYDLPHGVSVFLFVGRLMWYKGIRIILDALAALCSQGLDFRMVFIGSGTDKDAIRQYTHQLGLDGKCLFTGPIYDREELTAWYCRANLFLFPSTFDTSGLVVKEAAACSLASILVKGSCAAEGAIHQRNSFLIEENAASLAVCLAMLLQDKPRMTSVGKAAAEELYLSWDAAIEKAIRRYGTVMENYAAGRYKDHHRPADNLFKLESALDELLVELKNHINRD